MLKPFQSYMYKAKTIFEFRIKIACHEMDKPAQDRLKSALEAYQLDTITSPKRLPIQEHRDFPKMGACECWIIDIGVNYPTIAPQIRQIVAERAGITSDCICVYPLHQYLDNEIAEAHGKDHEGSRLDTHELECEPNAQEMAGQVRIGSLLKELESMKFEYAATEKTAGVQAADKFNTVSPIGTRQNKITSPVKGK